MRKDARVLLRFDKAANMASTETAFSVAIGEVIIPIFTVSVKIGKQGLTKLQNLYSKSASLSRDIAQMSLDELQRMQLASWWYMNAMRRVP